MIARIWRCVTQASQAENYLEILNKTVILPCQSAEGNQGIYILQELRDELAHFLLISFWESSQALEDFTGSDKQYINHSKGEMEFLIASESLATDYQVIVRK